MKRSTARWTTTVATAALLALPVGSWAQQTTPSTTPRQTPGAQSSQPSGRPAGADMQQGSANEHLRQAQSALADIPAASLTGTAKTRVAELKRHLNTLEQSATQGTTARRSGATASRATWSTEVASVDRLLTELLGADSATGATPPSTTGTSGATAGAPKTTTGSKAATLDEPARAKLQEVRTHVTAFAAAMSGTSATPSSDDPSTSASASAAPSATATPSAAGAATAATTGTAAPSQPAATPATPTPADPAAPATAPQSAATPSPAPAQQVDADTVKRHLTAARDTLSQLTQLPAAAQLTGDARTQVSQLISNFNELITTNTDWRAAYGKVDANLTALVGEQRADESPTPAAGTAGAVGTSGTTALDPGIRAKLVELRSHLMEFEKAAGGGAPKASTPAAPPSDTTAAAAAPDAAAPSAPASAAAASTPSAAAASAATGTAGRSAEPSATAGTSGRGNPVPAEGEDQTAKPATGERQTGKPTTPAAETPKAAEGHSAAMSHIEAIEAILNGTSTPAGTTAGTAGTAGSKAAKPTSLDSAKIEQIRTHLQQLRRELSQSGGR